MTDDITSIRDQIASQHGISPEDRDLLLTGQSEELLLMQAERLTTEPQRVGPYAPREGQYVAGPDSSAGTMTEFTRELFSNPDAFDL